MLKAFGYIERVVKSEIYFGKYYFTSYVRNTFLVPGILVRSRSGYLGHIQIRVLWSDSDPCILFISGSGYFVQIRIRSFWSETDPKYFGQIRIYFLEMLEFTSAFCERLNPFSLSIYLSVYLSIYLFIYLPLSLALSLYFLIFVLTQLSRISSGNIRKNIRSADS